LAPRQATLKYHVVSFLSEAGGRPYFLHEIYDAICKKLNKVNNEGFKAQIRGILNASIGKKEGIFKRIYSCSDNNGHKKPVKGLYSINAENKTDLERYIESVEEREECNKKSEKVSREDALEIYNNYMKFAYQQANKMYGNSCIVPREELQSESNIALFKGAIEFSPSKSMKSGNSPIPFLKRCINGSMLNLIRKQKLWNSRNVIVDDADVMDNVAVIGDDTERGDFTDEISISELRDILMSEMSEHLSPDEIDVVSMRWGLDGEGGETYKGIGRKIRKRDNKSYNDDSAKSWSWQVEQTARSKLSKNSVVLKKLFECYYA